MNPAITVLMSVHNGMPFVREAVDSILAQTFADFEFLILDDASADGTPEYLSSLRDKRARVISLPQNVGLTAALNAGLREARGEFVARQDADDVSDQRRLAAQHAFLQKAPSCLAVGAQARLVGPRGRSLGNKTFPLEHESIVFAHLFDNALAHSAVLFRRAEVEAAGGYDEEWRASQDYELWSRVSGRGQLRNLPDRLVTLRVLESSVTRTHARADLIRRVQATHFERLFQRPPGIADLDLIGLVRSRVVPEKLREFRGLLEELVARFEERNPGATRRADFRRMLSMLHERVGYNLLTLSRRSACKELWSALQTWPPAVFSMPWPRILALGIAGDNVRRIYEKLAR
jgi:glycosyltransferase involved in cell wall biosynthesis